MEKNAEQNGSAILREREKLDDRFGAILEKENFSKSVYFKRDQNEFPSYNSEYFEFSNTSILIIRNSFSLESESSPKPALNNNRNPNRPNFLPA